MPLSRYWSGDFVTPATQRELGPDKAGWAESPYITSDGPIPPGLPAMGAHTQHERKALVQSVYALVSKLPYGIAQSRWDETSDVESRSYRLSSQSYAALVYEAEKKLNKSPGRDRRKLLEEKPYVAHAAVGRFFLPVDFENALLVEQLSLGSQQRLLHELTTNTWSEDAQPAANVLIAAAKDAVRMRLPMIVEG